MSTSSAVAVAQPRASILAKMAERFSVDPGKLLATLKATAFRQPPDKPAATEEQIIALMIVADQYKLNPFTREIYAFADKSNGIVPVVGVDGWARIINEHPQFDGMSFDAGEDYCTCVIHRKDRSHPIAVTEYMRECKRATPPWSSHPQRMLRHRAMIQCARLAFGFVGIVDEEDAARVVDMGPADVVGSGAPSAIDRVRRIARETTSDTETPQPPPPPAMTPDQQAFADQLGGGAETAAA